MSLENVWIPFKQNKFKENGPKMIRKLLNHGHDIREHGNLGKEGRWLDKKLASYASKFWLIMGF